MTVPFYSDHPHLAQWPSEGLGWFCVYTMVPSSSGRASVIGLSDIKFWDHCVRETVTLYCVNKTCECVCMCAGRIGTTKKGIGPAYSCKVNFCVNWRVPWKNRISSTTMKLRKSLVKPVTQQNISSCSVLSPEIVMHDAFNADICIIVHDDLGWKNRTTRYMLPPHWLYKWFSSNTNVRRYMHRAWRSRDERTEQHFVIGFGELAAAN